MLRADQIAHLRPHQRPGTLRVLAEHHLIPDPHQIECVNLDQAQPTYFPGWFRNVLRVFNGLAKTAWALRPFGARRARSRQSEVAQTFQLAQRLDASASLYPTPGIVKPKMLTDRVGKRRAISIAVVTQKSTDNLNRALLGQGAFDLALNFHRATINRAHRNVQRFLRATGRPRGGRRRCSCGRCGRTDGAATGWGDRADRTLPGSRSAP